VDLPLADRSAAGRALAEKLSQLRLTDPVVLALPRGGVPVGAEIARALRAPLDLLLVRKIGAPWQSELAVAAVMDGADPVVVVDEPLCSQLGVPRAYIERQMRAELTEIARRRRAYLGERVPVALAGRTAIIVDDGIATGTTMRAAVRGLRRREPARVVLAIPVAPPDTVAQLCGEADDVVCLAQPEVFGAIGLFYSDFHQLSDEEVVRAIEAVGIQSAR